MMIIRYSVNRTRRLVRTPKIYWVDTGLAMHEYGRRSRTALLLHAGDRIEWLEPGILAAPWWRVN